MDRDSLIQRLMVTFLGELQDHAHALERDLLALEKGPGPEQKVELTNALFRTAHSLKGAARSMDIGVIEAACHQLEEVFTALHQGRVGLDADLLELLLATTDAIRATGMLLDQGGDASRGPLTAFIPRLMEAASAVSNVTPTTERRPQENSHAVTAADTPPASAETAPDARQSDNFVRLTTDKLDRLLAESSGLLLARNRFETRLENLEHLQGAVRRLGTEWSHLAAMLRKFNAGGRRSSAGPLRDAGNEALRSGAAMTALARCRGDLKQIERHLEGILSDLKEDCQTLRRSTADLEAEVHRARMLPFAEACNGLERLVRDLCARSGKAAILSIKGGGVEVDRAIIDLLRDPLRHLVHNAVDHGIEAMDIRKGSGKPEVGRVEIEAALRGTNVEVSISDDGGGLDLSSIRDHARKDNFPADSDQDLLQYIFTPGFSTATAVTDVSGRGVGLDVVKTQIEAMRGTIDVTFEPGRGTRFVLSLPLTLATIRALLVKSGGQTFAIDCANVRQLVRIGSADLQPVQGRPSLVRGQAPTPAADLSDLLLLSPQDPAPERETMPCVIVFAGSREAALLVDEVLEERELVVKNLGPRLQRLKYFSAGAVLPNNTAALILNCADLVEAIYGQAPGRTASGPATVEERPQQKRILVVDDSVTTRTMEKSILEAAGYEVVTAVDGAEAWQLLQESGVDLVVADVEMPRMDGFSLAERIRESKRFKELPIILVTARESDDDRARGLHIGVNAYLGKSAFDQRALLDAISQLL